MSKHQIDDGFTITVNFEAPDKDVYPTEIRLIAAHLGELLQQVIRESDTEE